MRMKGKITFKGGSGSGHFGHSGRPGLVGGSGGKSYSVVSETDVETAKILLTQGVEPSFKPDIGTVLTFAPGRGVEREGLYVANSNAFSKGSFGKVRLHMDVRDKNLKSPVEMTTLGRYDVNDVLRTENGAVTVGVLPKEVFTKVEWYSNNVWQELTPRQFLTLHNVDVDTPKLPNVGIYRSWLVRNADALHLSDYKIDEIASDYNRASLEDKIFMAQEAELIK